MALLLAVDLGTTGCRAIVFDDKLNILGSDYREYGLIVLDEKSIEQDAGLWWTLTKRAIKRAINEAGINAGDIAGVSVSSQGIAPVPVDRNLNPICNAISWLDVRSQRQTARIADDFGAGYIFRLTGKRPEACYTLPKLMWWMENRPEIYDAAYKFLLPHDFIIAKLTGRCCTDHTMASGTLMYDIKNQVWSGELLQKYGVSRTKLPELMWSGEAAGRVLPEVAGELGLSRDCVVAVGAQDQKCAALGAGIEQGVATISLGTAAAITRTWEKPETDGSTAIGWSSFMTKGVWETEGVVNSAAGSFKWMRDTLYPGVSYKELDCMAEESLKKGCGLMFYPHMSGAGSPNWYKESTGCFYNVTFNTDRGAFPAAVMEGVAFQIRELVECMGGAQSAVMFGGGAKSPLWRRISADILNMSVAVPTTEEAAGAGAAMCAGAAAGLFDLASPPRLEMAGEIEPDCERASMYEEKYAKYRAVEERIWGGNQA